MFARLALSLTCVVAFTVPATMQQGNSSPTGARTLFYDPVNGLAAPPAPVVRAATKQRPVAAPVAAKPRTGTETPVSAIAAPKYVGVHYWVELEGAGIVTANRAFKTGERIRVHLRTNVDGYLSLWSLDQTGKGTLLYPTSTAKDAFIKADAPYVTPGFIRFSPPAEDERLLLFFSRRPTDLPPNRQSIAADEVQAATKAPAGSRALVFETEEKNPTEIGTYIVNREGGPVVAEVRLKHVAQ